MRVARPASSAWIVAALLVELAGACLPGTGLSLAAETVPGTPARGVVLVARETLADPRFARSVVLLTEYGEAGAAGVILNRPTVVRVVDAIPAFSDRIRDPGKVMYFGGPVEAGVARVLVRTGDPLPGGTPIVEDVYAVESMTLLLSAFEDESFEDRARFFGGYAGWGPGQLEAEIRRGDWLLARASAETIFATDVDTLWDVLSSEFSGLWVHRSPLTKSRRDVPFTIILAVDGPGGVCESRHETHSGMQRPDPDNI